MSFTATFAKNLGSDLWCLRKVGGCIFPALLRSVSATVMMIVLCVSLWQKEVTCRDVWFDHSCPESVGEKFSENFFLSSGGQLLGRLEIQESRV